MFNDEADDITDDEDFMEFALLVAFPRKKKRFFDRPNHFLKWSDKQFFNRFRLSKSTVRFLLDNIEDEISSPTDRNNAVSAEEKIFITLRYYATGSFLAVCGDFAGVHKCTAGRIIRLVSRKIASLRPRFINFPSTSDEIAVVKQGFYNIAKFPNCIGAIDCTHVRIKSPGGEDAEIYRNRKGFFSVNVQTICDHTLRIQNIVCTWPGSSHDSTIFNHSMIKTRFEHGEMGDGIIVGDSGYALQKYLLTPFLSTTTNGQELYNESQIRTRNCVERSYGVWKKRFPILVLGISLNLASVESVIVATAVLHNIANHFGEQTPRVSHQLERLIDLSTFNTLNSEPQHGNRFTPGEIKRNCLVRYFDSLQ